MTHSGEIISVQESKHSGNITKLKEPMKRFTTFSNRSPTNTKRISTNFDFKIRCQLASEKFKSEINLTKKRSEKYQKHFMKIDAEIIPYLTGLFENTEVCDAGIKKWEEEHQEQRKINKRIQQKGRIFPE